jgi:hypothetical protein
MAWSILLCAARSAAIIAVATLAACGSDTKSVSNRLVSPEVERADLKRALDAGAISSDEYRVLVSRLPAG